MTGTAFRAYVEQVLVPCDVVVLDNLAAHKVDGVRQAIAASGASILSLPPTAPIPIRSSNCSPSSRRLREAAARSRDELWSVIGRPLETC
jgi:hypothetical protein